MLPMNAVAIIGYDALLLGLKTFTEVCADEDHKAGRRLLRHTVRRLQDSPLPDAIRAEAIRGIRRACGACKRCKGA